MDYCDQIAEDQTAWSWFSGTVARLFSGMSQLSIRWPRLIYQLPPLRWEASLRWQQRKRSQVCWPNSDLSIPISGVWNIWGYQRIDDHTFLQSWRASSGGFRPHSWKWISVSATVSGTSALQLHHFQRNLFCVWWCIWILGPPVLFLTLVFSSRDLYYRGHWKKVYNKITILHLIELLTESL